MGFGADRHVNSLDRLTIEWSYFGAETQRRITGKGIQHAYIKPRLPHLNGKFERSYRSDQQEFYQLLTYKDDVDLEAKLDEWQRFYNFAGPHAAFNGKTPYEAIRERL